MDVELNGWVVVQGGDGGLDNDEGLPWQLTVHFSRLLYDLHFIGISDYLAKYP